MARYTKMCWLVANGDDIAPLRFDSKELAEEFLEQHYPKGMGFHAVEAMITWEDEDDE